MSAVKIAKSNNFQKAYDSLLRLAANASQYDCGKEKADAYNHSASLLDATCAAEGIILTTPSYNNRTATPDTRSNKDYYTDLREEDANDEQEAATYRQMEQSREEEYYHFQIEEGMA